MGSFWWLGFAVAAAALWGMQNTLLEQLVKDVPLLMIGLVISLTSSVVLLTVYAFEPKAMDWHVLVTHKQTLLLLAALVVVTLLGNFGIWASIQGKNATVAGMIEASYPLFTILFSYLLFKIGHVNMPIAAGFILIVTGIGLVAYYAE